MTGANTIMTTTLPTIVGMGVVSKTTETMFSKQGHRKQSRSKRRSGTVTVSNRTYKIRQGERGGRYYVRKGRKVYI